MNLENERLQQPEPSGSPPWSPCVSVTDRGLRVSMWATAILLASGLFHLGLLAVLATGWDGPLSLRKPGLFGISAGLTAWSIAWLMTQLKPRRYDCLIANTLGVGLLLEVALITLQYWRGVPSHFNHSTILDASIELSMLGLILVVTAAIVYLSFRTRQLRPIESALALAIRGGMWLLALSCVLGILTTALGEVSHAFGRPHEYWGQSGVLKFPHGVALHAIQYLPIIAWIAIWLRVPKPFQVVKGMLIGQVVFLIYAVWQTSQGRSRFDFDTTGAILLGVTAVAGVLPTLAILRASCLAAFARSNHSV
ncbi:MAG: hypothetical protein SFV81_24105 [Pirellulaceae bacterium]|nr:hypothetical protein [Pirellulaceae bacterium]